MTEIRGMLTLEQLHQLAADDEVDTVIVAFPDLYGRLMGKRVDAGFFLQHAARQGTHACDYLFTVNMGMDPVAGYEFANWSKGYGDVHVVPDLASLRLASWLERTALVLCDTEDVTTHDPVAVAPRTILRGQVDAAARAGFTAMAASELEYYAFDDSLDDGDPRGHDILQPLGSCIEDYHILQGTRGEVLHGAIRRHLRDSGVPVETSKGEWGLGQHEINVRYADILTMADRHIVFKQCAREVADAQGRALTFMAKFREDRAGSSCHVHLSLWRGESNAFFGDRSCGPVECSDEFRWFLGGWIAHAPEVMVFYAPNVNSYKRYQAASWAPTRLAWSYDNRTAGFRVVGTGPSLRIECRIPGADCNPYLAFAAALASGLDGIEQRIEPPDLFDGDVYAAAEVPHVPRSLGEAVDIFAASDFAARAFGSEVVGHYSHFFRTEQEEFSRAVTDWERRRYFDQI